jgi:hypothetical protein
VETEADLRVAGLARLRCGMLDGGSIGKAKIVLLSGCVTDIGPLAGVAASFFNLISFIAEGYVSA